MKLKLVASLGELDNDRVVDAFRVVILGELVTESPRLHANHGVQLGIEIGRTAKHLGSDLVFLEANSRFIESMADFANPLVIGGNFNVLSTDIFFAVVGASHDQGRAAVLAIVLLAFTLTAFLAQRVWLGRRGMD